MSMINIWYLLVLFQREIGRVFLVHVHVSSLTDFRERQKDFLILKTNDGINFLIFRKENGLKKVF